MSYRFAKHLVNGNTIQASVSNYIANVKAYASISIAARVLFAGGLLVFLTYGIKFTEAKYLSLAIIILIFLVQLAILANLWIKRLNKLNNILAGIN